MNIRSFKDAVIGRTTVNREDYQDRRRTFLANFIDVRETRGIEFGGFDLPTVPRTLGDCAIADMRSEVHLSTEFDISIDDICFVDCIVEPGLAAYRQVRDRFDYTILCHVLEHIPDVISMINDLRELLVPGGILFIALPDKRETPDISRNSTTLSKLIERQLDHVNTPSFSEIAEFCLAWNVDFKQQYKDSMQDFFQAIRTHQLFAEPDIHCNVWQDDEFLNQLHELIRGKYIQDLEIIGSHATAKPFNEFYVALRRTNNQKSTPTTPARSTRRNIHHRTCGFCGRGQFQVWKRIHSPFPEKLYNDSSHLPDLGRELSLQYLTCRHCDLTSINPLPDFEIINQPRFCVHNALDLNESAMTDLIENRQQVAELISQQYEFERYRQTGRLLDVSCGPGIALAWLRDHQGWEVSGVEPAREFVDFAASRFDLEIFNGLVQDLDEPPGSFDVVMIDSSLQCVFDPLGTLLACHRLLRDGGCLFIQAPNRDGLGTQWLDLNVHWGNWFLYTAATLHRTLSQIGFETELIMGIQSPIDPRVIEVIPDDKMVSAESLNVSLRGHEQIDRYFNDAKTLHADFFGISARKLADHERRDDVDATMKLLHSISQASLRERDCVAIDPKTDIQWPWEEDES